MAASVRIEDEAFADTRYDELAAYAGLQDADHARGKMAWLWRQCTIEQTHFLPAFVVRKHLGPNGVDALVRARLGVAVDGDRVRIRGTKGRIEWLQKLRENGKKGGRPPRVRAKPSGSAVAKPSGIPELNPPAPAPAPAPTPTHKNPEAEEEWWGNPPKAERKSGKKQKTQVPEDWRPTEPIEFRWETELERFRNHHRAKGNTFANIDLAWKNWQSRSSEWGTGPSKPTPNGGGIRPTTLL